MGGSSLKLKTLACCLLIFDWAGKRREGVSTFVVEFAYCNFVTSKVCVDSGINISFLRIYTSLLGCAFLERPQEGLRGFCLKEISMQSNSQVRIKSIKPQGTLSCIGSFVPEESRYSWGTCSVLFARGLEQYSASFSSISRFIEESCYRLTLSQVQDKILLICEETIEKGIYGKRIRLVYRTLLFLHVFHHGFGEAAVWAAIIRWYVISGYYQLYR